MLTNSQSSTVLDVEEEETSKSMAMYREVETRFYPSPEPSEELTGSLPLGFLEEPEVCFLTVIQNENKYNHHPNPAYRRRIGRGGRMFIDRKNFPVGQSHKLDPLVADRFKFDRDLDDDEFVPLVDGNDTAYVYSK